MSVIVIITVIILFIPKQTVNWRESGSQEMGVSVLRWGKTNQDFWHQVKMVSNNVLIFFV